MKYVIAVGGILIVSFFAGLVLGMVASDEDPEERERDDRDQMEYLRKWNEKYRRS